MATLEKNTVIVIDPNEKKAEKTRKSLEKSMEKIAIINTKCLALRRQEINEIMHNTDYQKIFYGCNISFFNKMVEDFNLKSVEAKHIGWNLDISQIVIFYWKKKGFIPFSSATSRTEGTFGQEL